MEILIGVVGGLGLFLYGMRNMSDGLQKVAGDRLQRLLAVLTTNRFMGVLVGTLITALIQSSSTTTVMVVGFVNARLMTLAQAVGVIMGVNIGTTLTAQIIAFRLEKYAMVALGIGAVFVLFGRRPQLRNTGQVVLGFGMLFLGLELMSSSLSPLREVQAFRDLLVSFSDNPLLGVLAGTGITVIIQSSTASIGILQSLAGEGLIAIEAALPVLFGDNLGTTITAVLSAIGASVTARRAAAIHVIFNIIGVTLFLFLLPIFTPIVIASSTDIVRQIANAHTLFNIVNVAIQLPFAAALVWLAVRFVPGKEEEQQVIHPLHLDERFLGTPSVAITQVREDMATMANLARRTVSMSVDQVLQPNRQEIDAIYRQEETINRFNRDIMDYLSKLGQLSTTTGPEHLPTIRRLHGILSDIERIGDHGENLAELAQYVEDHKVTFSGQAMEEIKTISEAALQTFDLAVEAWLSDDPIKAKKALQSEKRVDQLEETFRQSHIDRLNNNECSTTAGVIFLDVASNLERVADHAINIAGFPDE